MVVLIVGNVLELDFHGLLATRILGEQVSILDMHNYFIISNSLYLYVPLLGNGIFKRLEGHQ
jgi:hypothetical protein